MSTNSAGIVILENFSMPFLTPISTMNVVAATKMVCIISGSQVEEMKPPKKLRIFSGAAPVKSNASALNRYSTLHPPTTE